VEACSNKRQAPLSLEQKPCKIPWSQLQNYHLNAQQGVGGGKQRKREWGEEREEERRQGEEVYTNILYFILVSLGRF